MRKKYELNNPEVIVNITKALNKARVDVLNKNEVTLRELNSIFQLNEVPYRTSIIGCLKNKGYLLRKDTVDRTRYIFSNNPIHKDRVKEMYLYLEKKRKKKALQKNENDSQFTKSKPAAKLIFNQHKNKEQFKYDILEELIKKNVSKDVIQELLKNKEITY